MRGMQCNVDCGYRLSICCRAEENHGIPSSIWPVAEHGVTHLLVSSGGFKKKTWAVLAVQTCTVVISFV
jgi:hypothetical protein